MEADSPRSSKADEEKLRSAKTVAYDIHPLRRLKPGEGLVIPLTVTLSFQGADPPPEQPPIVIGPSFAVDRLKVDGVDYPVRPKSDQILSRRGGRASASCPILYTREPASSEWTRNGTVITNQIGWSRRGFSETLLDRFHRTFLISEEEQEISFIDQVYLRGQNRQGKQVIMYTTLPALRHADGTYVTLREGDKLEFSFPAPADELIGPVYLRVHGYYVPVSK